MITRRGLIPRVLRSMKSRVLTNGLCSDSPFDVVFKDGCDDSADFTAHLMTSGSQIHPHWIEKLEQLEKPAARNLVQQLVPDNPTGYDQNSSKRIVANNSKSSPIKSGTLLHFIIEQKRIHPTKILLVRVGDFYESYGVDAILLVEHVGLAAMGGKAKAGCPTSNIQQTLDRLMEPGGGRSGFVVAVFEEGEPDNTSASAKKVLLKPRYLSQVVSPGQPTYLNDLCLKSVDIEYTTNKPFVGISRSANGSGYALSVAQMDDRRVRGFSRLTLEGLKVQLMRMSPAPGVGSAGGGGGSNSGLSLSNFIAEPVFVQNIGSIELNNIFRLPGVASLSGDTGSEKGAGSFTVGGLAVERLTGYADHLFPEQVLRRVLRVLSRPESDLARFQLGGHAAVAPSSSSSLSVLPLPPEGESSGEPLFTQSNRQNQNQRSCHLAPRPVYISTALQIGLLPNPNIPELIPRLLGGGRQGQGSGQGMSTGLGGSGVRSNSNFALCSTFLRNFLMTPPPLETANYMRILCHCITLPVLSTTTTGITRQMAENTPILAPTLPIFYNSIGAGGGGRRLMSMGKVTALLEAEQGNVVLFQQILDNLHAVLAMLRQSDTTSDHQLLLFQLQQQRQKQSSSGLPPSLSLCDLEREIVPATCMSYMNHALLQLVARTLDCGVSAYGGSSGCDDRSGNGSVTSFRTSCERIKERIVDVIYQPPPSPPSTTTTTTTMAMMLEDQRQGKRQGQDASVAVETMTTDRHGNIPGSFFYSNEHMFRFRVSSSHKEYSDQLRLVAEAAETLTQAVQEELWLRYGHTATNSDNTAASAGAEIGHDMINNRIFFEPTKAKAAADKKRTKKKSTEKVEGEEDSVSNANPGPKLSIQMPIHDKRGSVIANRYTTATVSAALGAYLGATEQATRLVVRLLKELSASLCVDANMQTLREVAQWNIIVSTVVAHVRLATQRQWRLPDRIIPLSSSPSTSSSSPSPSPSPSLSVATKLAPTLSALEINNIHQDRCCYDDDGAGDGGNGGGSAPTTESSVNDTELLLPGLIPYWMDGRLTAVSNDIAMRGMFLLTAPNMSGKSTLMRAVLTACLLGNCGMMVPCVGPKEQGPVEIPVYSNYFLRTTSYDVPVSNQSAFALEMDDVEVLLRECCNNNDKNNGTDKSGSSSGAASEAQNQRSLVMIDELGKGTSSRDGASLAGAILEELSLPSHGVMGIFATHLHEIFLLPLRFPPRAAGNVTENTNISYKTMQVRAPSVGVVAGGCDGVAVGDANSSDDGFEDQDPGSFWTYRLMDGICMDSMALQTARYCRLPARLLRRAEELSQVYDGQIFNFRDKIVRKHNGDLLLTCVDFTTTNKVETPDGERMDQPLGDPSDGNSSSYSSLEELLPAVKQISGPEASGWSVVEADQTVPIALENQCCVYILQLQKHISDPLTFYIGETASVNQRLTQWRRKFQDHVQPVRMLVIQLAGGGNRSLSQQLETKLLQQLKLKYNVDICNVSADENRKIF